MGSFTQTSDVTVLSFIKSRIKEYMVISDESVPVSVASPHLDVN